MRSRRAPKVDAAVGCCQLVCRYRETAGTRMKGRRIGLGEASETEGSISGRIPSPFSPPRTVIHLGIPPGRVAYRSAACSGLRSLAIVACEKSQGANQTTLGPHFDTSTRITRERYRSKTHFCETKRNKRIKLAIVFFIGVFKFRLAFPSLAISAEKSLAVSFILMLCVSILRGR